MLAGTHNTDFWLIKIDAFGNVIWDQTYGGPEYNEAESLIVTSDGDYAITGITKSFDAEYTDILLIKTDEYGVAPEAAWVILPLLLAATSAIFISKKKLFPKHS